ncbi:hypothetical protein [Streptomyces cyaneofuscatus]
MRSDQTAAFVATRSYASQRAMNQAIYEHNARVTRAPKGSPLAAEPGLTASGTTVMRYSDYECQACYRSVGMAFSADSTTHRIINRSGEPTRRPVSLCVKHWSETVRCEGDRPNLPVIVVRFG